MGAVTDWVVGPWVFVVCLLVRRVKQIVWPKVRQIKYEYNNASTFEEWSLAGRTLDKKIRENREWKANPMSNLFTWRKISERISQMKDVMQEEDITDARRLLELGMVRNYCNICDPRLYDCLYAGTKQLIEDYLATMVQLVDAIFSQSWKGKTLSKQERMDISDRMLSAYGNTALILQSGSIFGLCHVGVMKALYERNLLPKVIVGTGAGALMAALIGVHTDDELPNFLNGESINLEAFSERSNRAAKSRPSWYDILVNRLQRYRQTGYILHGDTLRQCVEANIGDMTFEEAWDRTGRNVSIVVSTDSPGTPSLLNYITAPNVLIRTAALASLVNDLDVAPAMIREKNYDGQITEWSLNDEPPASRARRRASKPRPAANVDKNIPLRRICSMENVNHFIISQARPYIVPFLVPSLHRSHRPSRSWFNFRPLYKLCGFVIQFWLNLIDTALGLPETIRRFVMDEKITRPHITLVPEVRWSDYFRLLRNPKEEEVKHWIGVGEKSVWPHVPALRTRCDIEKALDKHYQVVRVNRRPYNHTPDEMLRFSAGGGPTKRRTRAWSRSSGTN